MVISGQIISQVIGPGANVGRLNVALVLCLHEGQAPEQVHQPLCLAGAGLQGGHHHLVVTVATSSTQLHHQLPSPPPKQKFLDEILFLLGFSN